MTGGAAQTGPGAMRVWQSSIRPTAVIGLLLLGLAVFAAMALAIGAAGIPLHRLLAALKLASPASDGATLHRDQLVLWSVRLPRIVMAMAVGAMLAVSGAVMQGLFRNPLADPALLGVSSGGALAATTTIIVADRLNANGVATLSIQFLPVAAFLGSLAATSVLYRIATSGGRTSISIFLLGGLAIAALTNAGIGLLVFVADDRQLRDITFWMLGSLSGATWEKGAVLLPFVLAMVGAIPLIAHSLDLLVLGENEAFHLGVRVEWLKRAAILLISGLTGAAVAFAGMIGFVGIVVPHLLRLLIGPSHRLLLPASVCLGALFMLAADTGARTLAAPAEVPIGVLTALVGAPFFLAVLLRQRLLFGL